MARFKFHFSIFFFLFQRRPILVGVPMEIASWPRWFSRKIIFPLNPWFFPGKIHTAIFDHRLLKMKKRRKWRKFLFCLKTWFVSPLKICLHKTYSTYSKLSNINYHPIKKTNLLQWLPTILQNSVPKTSFRDSKSRENCRTSSISLSLDRLQIVNKNRGIKFRR